jgi:hypothetical protein
MLASSQKVPRRIAGDCEQRNRNWRKALYGSFCAARAKGVNRDAGSVESLRLIQTQGSSEELAALKGQGFSRAAKPVNPWALALERCLGKLVQNFPRQLPSVLQSLMSISSDVWHSYSQNDFHIGRMPTAVGTPFARRASARLRQPPARAVWRMQRRSMSVFPAYLPTQISIKMENRRNPALLGATLAAGRRVPDGTGNRLPRKIPS